MTLSLGW